MYNIRRILLYVLGLFLLSLGVALSIRSNLGVSPTSSVSYVLSSITGFTIGSVTLAYFLILILAQKIILGREFHAKNYLQIFFSSIFGLFTDISLWITITIIPTSYFVSLIILIISIIIIGIGLSFVLITDVIMNAPEGFCNAISYKWDIKFSKVKTIFDMLSVFLSITLAFVFIGEITQIREGTIIAALFVGKIVGIIIEKNKDKIMSLYS
jgi:uncharacterized membrane protein YczE